MDLHQLRHFLALAQTLNYRRTAKTMSIAQPALRQQIQQLEREVDALLFKRDKRKVACRHVPTRRSHAFASVA